MLLFKGFILNLKHFKGRLLLKIKKKKLLKKEDTNKIEKNTENE